MHVNCFLKNVFLSIPKSDKCCLALFTARPLICICTSLIEAIRFSFWVCKFVGTNQVYKYRFSFFGCFFY